MISINTKEDILDLKEYIAGQGYKHADIKWNASGAEVSWEPREKFNIHVTALSFTEKNQVMGWLKSFNSDPVVAPPALAITPTAGQDALSATASDVSRGSQEALIFGKDPTTHIVSIEAKGDTLELFMERNGVVSTEVRPHAYWLLSPRKFDNQWTPLAGNLHYKYIKHYASKTALYADKGKYREADTYYMANDKEAAMLTTGLTYYKGMKVDDVSRFHFDLETIGLLQAKKHRILLISTTFIKQGTTTKKLFSVDEYESDAAMLLDFCAYVRACNPSIVTGFNIFGFDFPYLQLMADEENIDLSLGRDGSNLRFDRQTSKFRKDGSQDYDYKRCHIYGREIVDMMFVAYHFDFARKYERYALKSIIKQEGLEKEGRQFYDAAIIHKNWDIPAEREKIKAYCIDDADDSESLFKLMIAAYFYLTPSIPKSFQTINYSASGSQLNSFLVRAYLQEGHSIPKADEAVRFPGAISDGYPGIYSNVFKVDVASLYPSIMLQYEVCHPTKDPARHFLNMVQYFTTQRLVNKKKGKETGDRHFKDLEQAQKIVINSAYGLLGATGLNFNFPTGAAAVTEHGREILKKAILWATGKEYVEKVASDTVDATGEEDILVI